MNPVIKVLALDIDGTLLNGDGRLLPENIQAIKRAQSQGIQTILATGKLRQSALEIIAGLDLQTPGVYTQGLLVYDGRGQILREISLQPELTWRILTYLEETGLPYVAYCFDVLTTPFRGSYLDPLFAAYGEPPAEVVPCLSTRLDEFKINKIIIGDEQDILARRRDLERRYSHEAKVLQAVPEFAEIMPQGSSKGEGVQWLLKHLGVLPENLLAVGDGENDIEMIALAGIGVAMGNAPAIVKESADFVTTSNDEAGVAVALQHFLPIR